MIKYNVVGEENKKLLIFITGAGVGAWMWEHQKEYFTDYKCIFFDLPGHGQNGHIDFSTISDVADFIKKTIVKESKNQKACLVGHSIGAQIIMHMIEIKSEFIDKAVIVSGLNLRMSGVNWLLKPMVSITMPLIKWRGFAKAQAKELSLPQDMFEQYYEDSLKISKTTLLNVLSENMNFEFKNLNNIKVSILILVGENEKKIMMKSAVKTSTFLKTNKLYIIKNAAHGIPYEQADLFNKTIKNFIEEKEILEEGIEKITI